MQVNFMNLFQAAAWIVAATGGLVAAFKAIVEMRKATEQRIADQRWKQAEMAKKCIDELFNRCLASCAMKMLDWDGREYKCDSRKTGPISADFRRMALRTEKTVFSPASDEQFVRDAFDELFDGFERLEHFVQINLIQFEDVENQFSYYVDCITRHEDREVFVRFMTAYNFRLGLAFLSRFPAWKDRY
jgi:hypothetical protein